MVKMYETFNDWKQTYGDIVSIKLFNQHWIILNSYRALKEAFITDGENFSARPSVDIFTTLSGKLFPVLRVNEH